MDLNSQNRSDLSRKSVFPMSRNSSKSNYSFQSWVHDYNRYQTFRIRNFENQNNAIKLDKVILKFPKLFNFSSSEGAKVCFRKKHVQRDANFIKNSKIERHSSAESEIKIKRHSSSNQYLTNERKNLLNSYKTCTKEHYTLGKLFPFEEIPKSRITGGKYFQSDLSKGFSAISNFDKRRYINTFYPKYKTNNRKAIDNLLKSNSKQRLSKKINCENKNKCKNLVQKSIETNYENYGSIINSDACLFNISKRNSVENPNLAFQEKWTFQLNELYKNLNPCHGRLKVLRYLSNYKLL